MKKNNKGFSLVELIIVIAIMAILAGAIAPALIRYIDKSRKSNDVSAAKTIKTAVETAMSNEMTYELLTAGTADSPVTVTDDKDKDGNDLEFSTTITVEQAKATGAGDGTDVKIHAKFPTGSDGDAQDIVDAQKEVGKNIGEKTPRIKFKKAADEGTATPSSWTVLISKGGSVIVGISDSSNGFYQLAPEVSKYYQ